MDRRHLPLATALLLGVALPAVAADDHAGAAARWPSFRGVDAAGAGALPRTWGADSNVAWAVEVDGFGQSSPIAWGGRVFVTSVVGPNKELNLVHCFRADDGQRLWTRSFEAGVKVKSTEMVSRAVGS